MPALPVTPDGRYFVVRGRLWRMSDPALPPDRRELLVAELMAARRAVGQARRANDIAAEAAARGRVDAAKRALGERGEPWWSDGAPDFNRRMVSNSPYANWFEALPAAGGASGRRAPVDDQETRKAAEQRQPVRELVAAAVAELRRQEEISGCTVAAEPGGDLVQVDGSFDIRKVVEAVIAATSQSA